MEVIGAFIGDMLAYLFVDVLCHGLGFTWLWIKNGGRKSYKQILQETDSLSEVGKSIIAKTFAAVMLFLLIALLVVALYWIVRQNLS